MTTRDPVDELRLDLLDGNLLEQLPPPEPLIDGVLVRGTLAALYGAPGGGKSFVGGDWSMCVATGTPWMGRSVAWGRVLYVAAEGGFGLAQRRRAWMQHHKVESSDRDKWLLRSVNLLDAEWAQALVELAKAEKPIFVIIDTLARSMPGGEENSSKDMGQLIAAADAVRYATGATVLLVHHVPRNGNTLRGHTSLEGAVDTAIELRPEDTGGFTLRCWKQKDGPKFAPITAKLKVVGSSCVVVPCDPAQPGAGTLTDTGRKLLETLDEVDTGTGVSSTVWLTASGMAERSFYRARGGLVKAALVGSNGAEGRPLYTLTDQGKRVVGDGE